MMQNSIRLSLFVAAGAVFLTCASPNRGGTGMGGSTGTGGGGNYTSGTGNVAPPLAGTGTSRVPSSVPATPGEASAETATKGAAAAGPAPGETRAGVPAVAAAATGRCQRQRRCGRYHRAASHLSDASLPHEGELDLGDDDGGRKDRQLHQVERANVSASDITSFGVGSVYSQGSSAPAQNTPTGWADMIDGFRKASYASRLKVPVIYGLDVVHGAGPVYGATVFPHNIGLGATRDPALVEEVARAVAEESAGVGADFLSRRSSRWRATSDGAAPTRRSARRWSSPRSWAPPTSTGSRSAAAH